MRDQVSDLVAHGMSFTSQLSVLPTTAQSAVDPYLSKLSRE